MSDDPRDKPEQILQGAIQVFLRHGYAATSMDRVAVVAGVSKHTIYHHFENKEGLFAAIFERLVLQHFHLEFGCNLVSSAPPAHVLTRLAEVFLARMDDPEYIAFVRLLFAESGRFPELAHLYRREVMSKGNLLLTTYFKAHPELRYGDPEMAAHIFWGTLVAYVLGQGALHGQQADPIPRGRLIQELVELICGVATRP